jgi:hypothetical protein
MKDETGIKVYAHHEDWSDTLSLYIVEKFPDGRRAIILPVKLDQKTFVAGEKVEPSIELNGLLAREFLQAMCDLCHAQGLHPTGVAPLENEMSAVRYHLEDMRKLVFSMPRIVDSGAGNIT